jgi:hypothetical protein
MIAAVFLQFLNVDNLIAEPPDVGDMLNRLRMAADFESTENGARPNRNCFDRILRNPIHNDKRNANRIQSALICDG